MHLWGSARVADGDSYQQGHGRRPPRGQHHGQQTHGQRHALRHVPVYGQPDGCCRYRRGFRRIGAHALHTHDHGTLGAWRAHRSARQHARSEQQLQTDVHVGGRDLHQPTGPIYRDGALTILLN